MRCTDRPTPADPPPARARSPRGWRRLAVIALAPLLALTAGSATAQGVWITVPSMPAARSALGGATANCPEGLRGKCVYAVPGTGVPADLAAYSPAVNTWATLPAVKTPRTGLAVTTAPCPPGHRGECVYAVGGTTGGPAVSAVVEAYSVETNAWISLPSLPTARTGAAAATAPCTEGTGLRGSCVYVFGGADAAGVELTTVEAYSPATGIWSTVTPLQTARFGHVGAAAPCAPGLGLRGTCLYAIGGGDGAVALNSVEVYSPVLNAWVYAPALPTARFQAAGAAAPCPDGMTNGCVYVTGGSSTAGTVLATVEAYSPVSNAWVTLPSMPTARQLAGSAAAPCTKDPKSNCVYVFGGTDITNTATAVTEAFAIEPAKPQPKPQPKPPVQPKEPTKIQPPLTDGTAPAPVDPDLLP